MQSAKAHRRKFLKYVGAGAVAVGATAAGYYFHKRGFGQAAETTIPTASKTATTLAASTRVNHPPVIYGFESEPKYLAPTTEQTIKRAIQFYDPDNDLLTATWFVDSQEVGHGNSFTTQLSDTRNVHRSEYLTRLPEGNHVIEATVSDATENVRTPEWYGEQITVEPDQVYPSRPAYVKYKGMNYYAGPMAPEWPTIPSPTKEEMGEQLSTIRNELQCNAIIICGGALSENNMLECGRLAIEKEFDKVYIQPRYVNATVEETIEKVGKFAEKVRELRETSESVVYHLGHEFQLETAIIRGRDWFERFENALRGTDLQKVEAVLPRMFRKLIEVCSENYGYPISYAASPWEAIMNLIPWSNASFESIGVNTYIQDSHGMDENWWLQYLSSWKRRYRKPIHSTDWGMTSFRDADKLGGMSPLYFRENRGYDEEPQVRYMERTLAMLNKAKIEGSFWVQYNDNWEMGHCLYHPVTRRRKKGFYMYKSYQRTP